MQGLAGFARVDYFGPLGHDGLCFSGQISQSEQSALWPHSDTQSTIIWIGLFRWG